MRRRVSRISSWREVRLEVDQGIGGFFNDTAFVGGQGVPVFVPGLGDEGMVVRFEVVGWN